MKNISMVKTVSFSLNDIDFTTINFINGSAFYEAVSKLGNHGVSIAHKLGFNLAGINDRSRQLIAIINLSKTVRFIDVQGEIIELSKNRGRFIFEFKEVFGGKAGSFRGFEVVLNQSTTVY